MVKISDLPNALTAFTLAVGDLFAVVDISANETKKITAADIAGGAGFAADFASRTAAEAANIPAPVQSFSYYSNSGRYTFQRDAAGTALTTNDGATWSPARSDGVPQASPEHWGDMGAVDDSTKFSAALAYLDNLGGGILTLGPNLYRAKGLDTPDNLTIRGVRGATIIKVPDGSDAQILNNVTSRVGGGQVQNLTLENIIFDGNKANAPKAAPTSAVAFQGVKNFIARACVFQNASGYGLGFQGYPSEGSGYTGIAEYVGLEYCEFLNNGDSGSGYLFDGVDVKYAKMIKMFGCRADGNTADGFDFRCDNSDLTGNWASNNGDTGFALTGNSFTDDVEGRHYFAGNTVTGNNDGVKFADGAAGATNIVRLITGGNFIHANTRYGVILNEATSDKVTATFQGDHVFDNGDDNFHIDFDVGPPKLVELIGVRATGSTAGSGVWTYNGNVTVRGGELTGNNQYGFEEGAAASNNFLQDVDLRNNTTGAVLENGTTLAARDCRGYAQGGRYISSAIDVSTIGVKTVDITHGLDITPSDENLTVSLAFISDTALRIQNIRPTLENSTIVRVALEVTTAATSATAQVNLDIRERERT